MRKSNLPTATADVAVSPAEMSQMTQQALALASWEPVNFKDHTAIADRCQRYFDFCIDSGRRPLIQGLCLALGTTRPTLIAWEQENTPRGEVIRKSKQIVRMLIEEWTAEGKISPPSGIFLLKNICGYADNMVIEARPAENTSMASMSPEQIAAQIEQDIPVDDDTPTAAIMDDVTP